MIKEPKIKKPRSLDELKEGEVVMLRKREWIGLKRKEMPARFSGVYGDEARFLLRYNDGFIDRLSGRRKGGGIARIDIKTSDLKINDGVVVYSKYYIAYFPSNSFHPIYKFNFNAWYYTHAFYDADLTKSGL